MKTIKHFLTLAIGLLAFSQLHAQMSDGVRFGLKAGMSAANFSRSDFDDRKGRVGFVGGVFSKIPLGGRRIQAALRPELLFTMKGATVNGDSLSDLSFKLNYVELPLSLDINVLAIFNVHAGVQAGTLISSSDVRAYDPATFDAGWHLGGGIDLGNIGLHVRYNSSFTQLFDELDDNETRNWNLTVAASFAF